MNTLPTANSGHPSFSNPAISQLAIGPQAYDNFVALARNPILTAGEYVVVIGGLLHGLNGIRIVFTSFGRGAVRQKQLFYALMTLAGVAILYFGFRMFGGG